MSHNKNKSAYKINNNFDLKDLIKMQPEFDLISSMAKSKMLVGMLVAGLAAYTAFAVFLFKMASI